MNPKLESIFKFKFIKTILKIAAGVLLITGSIQTAGILFVTAELLNFV